MKKSILLAVCALGAISLHGTAACAAGDQFEARITPVPMNAADRATISGQGTATASLEGQRLKLRGSYRGLRGPATHASLHMGSIMGVRGAAFADVNIANTAAGEFSTEMKLTRQQIDALRAGRIYIQIDSTVAPGGNLWGWLLEVAP